MIRQATTEDSSVVQIEGNREVQRPLTLYNLDAILAVEYQVRSPLQDKPQGGAIHKAKGNAPLDKTRQTLLVLANLFEPRLISENSPDTYQHSKEEERYARRVEMDEIKENGYNLNISRYVSTAQPEEEYRVAGGSCGTGRRGASTYDRKEMATHM